jgi:hypothetical protein
MQLDLRKGSTALLIQEQAGQLIGNETNVVARWQYQTHPALVAASI